MALALKTFYVYVGDHPATGQPFYVGKGITVGLGRATRINGHNHHLRKGTHHNRRLQRAYDKHGPISWSVIRPGVSEQEAFETEIALIAHWGRGRGELLCNMTDGGDGASGYRHSQEAIAKMSAVTKGRKMSAETKAKIGAASKVFAAKPANRAAMLVALHGPKARAKAREGLKGKTLTSEHRAKIGDGNRGKVHSEATCAKNRAAKLGTRRGPPSAETRAKMSAANKGKPGRRQSPEVRAKISATLKAVHNRDQGSLSF